jgi:hypothetical protein
LTALYTEMKGTPVPMDLDAVFGKTVFDDHAPLAAIRRSVTEPARHSCRPSIGAQVETNFLIQSPGLIGSGGRI